MCFSLGPNRLALLNASGAFCAPASRWGCGMPTKMTNAAVAGVNAELRGASERPRRAMANSMSGVHGDVRVGVSAAQTRQQFAADDMQSAMDEFSAPSRLSVPDVGSSLDRDPATPAANQRSSTAEAPSPSIASPSIERVRELVEEQQRITNEFSQALVQPEPEPDPEPTPEELVAEGAIASEQFKFGRIFFEETGVTAPYLIVPEGASGEDIVMNVAKFMKKPDQADDDGPISKPSILFEVRAKGMSYMSGAEEVMTNEYLKQQWFGEYTPTPDAEGVTKGRKVDAIEDKDQQVRKFCDRTLNVFKDVVKGVANADGWFLNSAGRGAPHQLIGDSMDTFDALEDTTWVNFASLANEHLFAAPEGAGQMIDGKEKFGEALHDHMMKELRIKSVPIPTRPEEGEKEIKLPKLDDPVHYVTPKTKFPTLEELQGSKTPKDGEDKKLLDWLKERMKALGHKKEMHLHPRATHFIFFVRLDSTQLSAIV